ncbi:MAG: prepilin-type N-terminal cleavage/methylation domain-containing protein [Cyanobacteria bacterium RM1_2_2]|nr:prepilin-type N-terminal cleavage/methylation domain-containing protein [Cyanobacteria bacterium RM1_2_2]
MSKPPYRSATGFTLFELLIVIVIAGILALIAAPGWLTFMNSRRANAGRDQVLQLLRQAQSQAIRSRRSQVVTFETPENELPLVTISGIAQKIDGQVVGATPKNFGLEVVDDDPACPGDAGCVIFNDRGNVSKAGTVINITSPAGEGAKRCVIVETLLGAMRSTSGDDCKAS